MCGIIGAINKKGSNLDLVKLVKEQYEKQQTRGRSGFGFVAITDNGVVYAKSKYETAIIDGIDKIKNAKVILFHHRVPTSSPNAVTANHPIFVSDEKLLKYKYFLIHNGHISNFETLQKENEKEGFQYKTRTPCKSYYEKEAEELVTDSEALGIDVAQFIEGKKKNLDSKGLFAFMILQMTRDNEPVAIYYGRNGNPIKFYQNEKLFFMASEAMGLTLPLDKLYRYDLGTDKYDFIDMNDGYKTYNTQIPEELDELTCEQEELGFKVDNAIKEFSFPMPINYFWRKFNDHYNHVDDSTKQLIEERDTIIEELQELEQELSENLDMTDKNSVDYAKEIIKEARKKFGDAKELDKEIRKVVDSPIY